jgi:bifunctional non-homologous end joining protein LigD
MGPMRLLPSPSSDLLEKQSRQITTKELIAEKRTRIEERRYWVGVDVFRPLKIFRRRPRRPSITGNQPARCQLEQAFSLGLHRAAGYCLDAEARSYARSLSTAGCDYCRRAALGCRTSPLAWHVWPISRHGNDFTARFPLAAAAVASLQARSFLIDGEAIVTDAKGLAVFDLIRRQRHGSDAVLIGFDLIELDGEDLRVSPIEQRKRRLPKLVRGLHPGIVLNEFFERDGYILFEHACKLGCEGIVSKRLGSHYRSGRSPHCLKVKNPKAAAKLLNPP